MTYRVNKFWPGLADERSYPAQTFHGLLTGYTLDQGKSSSKRPRYIMLLEDKDNSVIHHIFTSIELEGLLKELKPVIGKDKLLVEWLRYDGIRHHWTVKVLAKPVKTDTTPVLKPEVPVAVTPVPVVAPVQAVAKTKKVRTPRTPPSNADHRIEFTNYTVRDEGNVVKANMVRMIHRKKNSNVHVFTGTFSSLKECMPTYKAMTKVLQSYGYTVSSNYTKFKKGLGL